MIWYCCHDCGHQWNEFEKIAPPENCVSCGSNEISQNHPMPEKPDGHLSVSIECPSCGMPYDVPESVDRWSCDCGESWEIEQTGVAENSDQ